MCLGPLYSPPSGFFSIAIGVRTVSSLCSSAPCPPHISKASCWSPEYNLRLHGFNWKDPSPKCHFFGGVFSTVTGLFLNTCPISFPGLFSLVCSKASINMRFLQNVSTMSSSGSIIKTLKSGKITLELAIIQRLEERNTLTFVHGPKRL